jgi:hypothetical protein
MVIFSHIEHISHKYQIKVTFSHIEYILHKYPLKLKFSQKWSYFHTLSIFTQLFCYFLLWSCFLYILDFFMAVIAQIRSFVGRWYSGLDHRGDESRNLIKLIKLFRIDNILDSDNSSFPGITTLSLFCCVWNIEHLSNVFC